MTKISQSRRNFLHKIAGATAGLVAGNAALASMQEEPFSILTRKRDSPNDLINIAVIGCGVMGVQDAITALSVPGTKMVAACDLYTGRLTEAKDRWGKDIFVTRNYKELLQRNDVDAVIIATPDHWHKQISIDALKANKHVYCEKPLMHSVKEGQDIINAWKKRSEERRVGKESRYRGGPQANTEQDK